MSIKRYDSQKFIAGMFVIAEKADGKYVLHSDYEELQSQLIALTSQLESVVAENAALKSAFDNPDAWLSWHAIPPTWEDPLPCGEYLDVHDTDGHKNSDGTDCWPVFARPEIETISTDAFLAEVRASGVEMLLSSLPPYYTARADIEKFAAQLRQGGAV